MINKHREIRYILKLIQKVFGQKVFTIEDFWDDYCAIGLRKDKKLIYIAYYSKDDYFYECEILLNNKNNPYTVDSSGNITKEYLPVIISNFFVSTNWASNSSKPTRP